MWHEVQNHKLAYFFLIAGLAAFVWGYASVWPNQTMERVMIAGLTLGYFLWGITTHVKSKRLTGFVVQEYAAIAVLGGLVLLLLTF